MTEKKTTKADKIQKNGAVAKEATRKIERRFQGEVVSDKMDKTVVVKVSIIKFHPKYHKRYRQDKRYKVHDPKNQFKTGDSVTFVPSRPYSKDKRWIVIY